MKTSLLALLVLLAAAPAVAQQPVVETNSAAILAASPACEVGSCGSVTAAVPTIDFGSDGLPVTFGTVYVTGIPYDPATDGIIPLYRGITTPVDQIVVNDSLVTGTADHFGTPRMLPSIGGVDLTATGTSLNVNVTGTSSTTANPCQTVAWTFYRVHTATSGTLEIANAVSGEFFTLCGVDIVTTLANSVLISEDDTDGCGSPTAGVTGSDDSTPVAGDGWPFGANGGLVKGFAGYPVAKTRVAARYLCLQTSVSTQTSGVIAYVSAP